MTNLRVMIKNADSLLYPNRMNVAMNYDASFNAQFGDDGYNVMRRVAAHAENLYQHPTLINPISWVISGNIGIAETIEASVEDL